MSITIRNSPTLVCGAYNELFHTSESTEAGDSAFRFKNILQLATFNFSDVILNPYSGAYNVFNAKRLISTQLTRESTDFLPTITTWEQKAKSIIDFQLAIEEYGVGTDTDTHPIRYAINAVNPMRQDGGYLYNANLFTKYVIYDSKGNLFLQTWSGNRKARRTDIGTISLLNGKFDNTYNAKIKRIEYMFYGTGGAQRGYYITNPDYGYDPAGVLTNNVKKMRLDAPAFPVNIDTATTKYLFFDKALGGTITPAVLTASAIMQPDYYKYTITVVGDVGDNVISEVVTVDLIDTGDDCTKYIGCQIAFRNSLGSYEYYPFTLATINSFKINRNTYEKNKFSLTSYTMANSAYSRGLDINNIDVVERMELNSDFYTTTISENLKELFLSTDVYVIISGTPIPVILDMDDYTTVSKEWAKQGRLSLSVIKSIIPNTAI